MSVSCTGIGITFDPHPLKDVMQQAAVSQDWEPLNNIFTYALSVDRYTTEMKSSLSAQGQILHFDLSPKGQGYFPACPCHY